MKSAPRTSGCRSPSTSLELVEIGGDPERRPLVLLHEGLGSARLWRELPQRLHDVTGRRVVAYSRHGHGASPPPPVPRDPSFFELEARVVLPELLRELGAERPILVGHSDGASIALLHAAEHPVTGLALIAPHVFVEEVTASAIRETRERYRDGDLRERMSRHHADPDAAFWGWCDVWLDPAFRDWDIAAAAAEVTCPTLLLQGVDDPYGSLAQLDRIAERLPGACDRRHLPGGHSPHLEAEAETLAALEDFCRPLP